MLRPWRSKIDKMYDEMKCPRRTSDLERSLGRRQNVTLVVLLAWIILEAFLFVCFYKIGQRRQAVFEK